MSEITTWMTGILMSYAAFLLAIASPGPNVLAVIGTSMRIGRKSGIALATGVAAGSLAWAMLTVAGLTALLATWAPVLTGIKIFGGFYLLWLGYKALKSASSTHDLEARILTGGPRSLTGYALRGFTIQMSNPKAVLAWIAIVSLGFQDGAPVWVGLVIVVGTTLLSVAIHILYAVAFSTPAMIRAYSKARRSIQITLGVFFGVAGAKLLLSEL
ncbi:LysE family translocator [Paenirhodobacter populi]|uniref:LysE family translocator n=1 Tax=Paenirhodobacter populi TaxID=2306993 RepID=A0A443J692_9RHOB|nr:LysE family transporter [Sinirhodobacter populi]RWR16001.1 LysE family translocator [Sinirhodobacter populi]